MTKSRPRRPTTKLNLFRPETPIEKSANQRAWRHLEEIDDEVQFYRQLIAECQDTAMKGIYEENLRKLYDKCKYYLGDLMIGMIARFKPPKLRWPNTPPRVREHRPVEIYDHARDIVDMRRKLERETEPEELAELRRGINFRMGEYGEEEVGKLLEWIRWWEREKG